MISDHVAITPDVQARYPAPLYDPFTTLGWLAGLLLVFVPLTVRAFRRS